jgi:lipoprotein NlpD
MAGDRDPWRRARRCLGWLAAAAVSGCATVTEAPVVDRTIERAPMAGSPAPRTASIAPGEASPPPGTHRVAQGDTLYGIAFRHDLDFRALAEWNAIAAPYTIRPGQVLRLTPPPAVATAPVAAPAGMPVVEAPVVARPAPLPVEPPPEGEAQTYGIDDPAGAAPPLVTEPENVSQPEPLAVAAAPSAPTSPGAVATPPASAPPAARPAALPAGPLSRAITEGAPRAAPPAVDPRPSPRPAAPASAPPASAPPATPPSRPVPEPPVAPAAASIAPAPSRRVGGVDWRWPASGALLLRFLPGDPARQGIDIQGKAGGPVLAAADGEVVYSGNGLVGYGELVIIKHSPEFLSAYGHNRKRLVAEGQRVRAGQPIAELGRSPAGLEALHFEIRRSGKPIDPLQVLPPR